MATYILIPGGWHGGWYFQSLAEALRVKGHQAYAITLTGIGERRHLLHAGVNLDTHIDDVVQLLEMENLTNVILIGHSYAGMVLTGVIDRVPNRIASAIYCDAYVPADGQSCFDLVNDFYRKLFLDNVAKDGYSVTPSATADPRTTSHPMASFLQRLSLKNAPAPVKRCYIYLSGWDATPFTSTYERLKTSPDWQVYELPVRHNVIAVAFDELLGIALKYAD